MRAGGNLAGQLGWPAVDVSTDSVLTSYSVWFVTVVEPITAPSDVALIVSELDRRILRDQADLAVISDLDADVDIAAG